MRAYHDDEWGVPVHDDRTLFEFLCLEGAQAGLSWRTILLKRARYRALFHDFADRYFPGERRDGRVDAETAAQHAAMMAGHWVNSRRFESGFLRAGARREALARLTCPIGGSDVDDKRPEVIAALTAAELVRCLLGRREPAKGRRSRHETAA